MHSPHAAGATYLELIQRGAAQHGPRVAIVCGDAAMTFTEVDLLSNRLGHALRAAGAAPRDRVALLVNNSILSVPLDFACVKAGLNRVPLNSRLSAAEHVRMVQDTGATMLVHGQDLAPRAAEIAAAVPGLALLGLGSAVPGGSDLLAQSTHAADTPLSFTPEPDDIVLRLFTSGTTGTLKAAQHTQASYAAICRNVLLNLLSPEREDAMLHAASLIHASGVFVLPFWLRGARTVVLAGFEPGVFLQAIADHRITAINLVPTMLQMLFEHPGIAGADVSSLRQVIYGASPMPRAIIERGMALWGQHRFYQYYGQTEVPLCLAVLRPQDHQGERLAACGQPGIDVEIKLLDDDGNEVPHGTPGEIAVRAPSAVRGYHNAPELNAGTFTADGWVRTRDVGVFDAEGFLYLKDRTSDMIISGGYNVYPREVEDVLLSHPAIAECAVVGAPDEKWVEVVTAVAVLRPGHAVSEDALIAFVASALASYKKPQRITFAQAIPKTAVGKINRRLLREQFREAHRS